MGAKVKTRDPRETLNECREELHAAFSSLEVLVNPNTPKEHRLIAKRSLDKSLANLRSAADRAREGVKGVKVDGKG